MAYLTNEERDRRLAAVRMILDEENLDLALIYYDEFNIGNGWYLTGWCPQFESGAVLVARGGEAMILGGRRTSLSPNRTAQSGRPAICRASWSRTRSIPMRRS